jgi:hypothetical protein
MKSNTARIKGEFEWGQIINSEQVLGIGKMVTIKFKSYGVRVLENNVIYKKGV